MLRGGRGAESEGRAAAVLAMSRWESGKWRWEGRGVVAMAGERPAFLREIFLRRVAESGR